MRLGLGLVVALAAAGALLASSGAGSASTTIECRFTGPGYPSLTPTSRPANTYVVFVKRQLTCDQARTIARRGTKTPNPGPLRTFHLPDGWGCVSFAPRTPGNGKVLAGQCTRQGGQLVNWLPICEQNQPCKKLRRS
jgi:hypothetical protein